MREVRGLVGTPVPRDGQDEVFFLAQVEVHVDDLGEELFRVEVVFLRVFDSEVGLFGPNHRVEVVVEHVGQPLHDFGHGEGVGERFGEELEHGYRLIRELHVALGSAFGGFKCFLLLFACVLVQGLAGSEFFGEIVNLAECGEGLVQHESDIVEE